ncbi:saccharopine dehydrogenase family protein [Pollutibacter soli]|uniref:saccharopine dehydrogenase family protein n=1 Tax=Pollutibacter soli TaxID=3034157 RepID=UPI003013F6AF
MASNEFLLYGANGYTGKLIARLASDYQLSPILAGRNEQALKELSAQTGFRYLCFSLEDKPSIEAALAEVPMVLLAAGPFIHTCRPVIKACLKLGKHYIDINGDIKCFEIVHGYHEAAREKQVMLLPGAGFDVIPTDCLALKAKKLLPDANELKLAFANLGSMISHGTALTMAGKLGEGASKRENGRIVSIPFGSTTMEVDFGVKKIKVMNISWGDVFTAWYSTGIPNIETYAAAPRSMINAMKYQQFFNWLLRTEFVRNIIRRKISKRAPGPDDEMLRNGKSFVWAQVKNPKGEKVTIRMEAAESYLLTAHGTLIITKKILNGNFKPGFQTPATCYGDGLIEEIPGTTLNV